MTRWLPWLLLGPVTGPLAYGVAWNAQRGRWLSAGLCVAGIVAFLWAAPMLLMLELRAWVR